MNASEQCRERRSGGVGAIGRMRGVVGGAIGCGCAAIFFFFFFSIAIFFFFFSIAIAAVSEWEALVDGIAGQ